MITYSDIPLLKLHFQDSHNETLIQTKFLKWLLRHSFLRSRSSCLNLPHKAKIPAKNECHSMETYQEMTNTPNLNSTVPRSDFQAPSFHRRPLTKRKQRHRRALRQKTFGAYTFKRSNHAFLDGELVCRILGA